ncbi:winged helix-turn-helix transcriptional regulator [Nonomuraea diastatica]|uniref:Transcriptional regulator n=1 Tax=Nonomuraea diastatica TaxID=1848329 RepID=A0A4R4WT54_9ACTN|nr:helix-turn-helix domain-containing protein [Nonomuraea diastatica]TDD20803.1 transcriptional regulator [Nonomuraea diastatica]
MSGHVSERPAPDESVEGFSCEAQFTDVFRVLGKRWNGMIIVALLHRPARFSELARAIPGITDGLLTDRLRELTAARLVERHLAGGSTGSSAGSSTGAVLYRLTPAGEDLRDAFQELRAWADRNNISELCGQEPAAGAGGPGACR